MGVTIHYLMIAREGAVGKLNEKAMKFFKRFYSVSPIDDEGEISISRICFDPKYFDYKDVNRYLYERYLAVITALIDEWSKYVKPVGFMDPDKGCFGYWEWNKEIKAENKVSSVIKGMVVENPTSEAFNFLWYKVGDYWVLNDSTKTQPFKLSEYEENTSFHVVINAFLKFIVEKKKEYGILKFHVVDEGEYYNTGSLDKLIQNFGVNLILIDMLVNKQMNLNIKAKKKISLDINSLIDILSKEV